MIDQRQRSEPGPEAPTGPRRAPRQAALLRLSAELAATLDNRELCTPVVTGLHDTLGYDHVALFLVDEASVCRVVVAGVGFLAPPPKLLPGQGLSERPLLDGQLHYTPDVTHDPRYIGSLHGSEVDVPVRIGGRVLGVLVAESRERHPFDQDDLEVLEAAALQAGPAIEKAPPLTAQRRRAGELEALRTTMTDITAELELSALLQAVVERASGLLGASAANALSAKKSSTKRSSRSELQPGRGLSHRSPHSGFAQTIVRR